MAFGERVWLAEKPSFAKELGKALGNCTPLERYAWRTNGGIIVAAAGHLVELAEPHDYREEWRDWRPELLPMVPDNWNFLYRPINGKEAQLGVINKYASKASEIIVATDAGREGEYIAWAIMQYLGLQSKPKRRLWSSGANVQSISKAASEAALLDYSEKFHLAEAARIRAESDWVEGLNLTRLLTKRFRPADHKGTISVGRVQTAALAIIVRRQREIETFQPERYYDMWAEINVGPHTLRLDHVPKEEHRIKDAALARRIAESANGKSAALEVKSDARKEAPPSLFESSSLQIRAYNLWGWSASKTEELAQALYDKHKLISYPRTDGVHLETEQWHDVREILQHLSQLQNTDRIPLKGGENFVDIASHVPDYNGLTPRTSVFNSELLEKSGADHHGIIPTTEQADLSLLDEDERKLYLLIARQFLAQLLPDCNYLQKSISWTHEGRRFATSGRVILKAGWKVLFGDTDAKVEDEENDIDGAGQPHGDLPDIPDGARGLVKKAVAVEKKTVAPPQFTEGSIISAMRDLTKVVKDPLQLEKVKVARVLGTKSTWGETVKKLKDRRYIVSTKGKLSPTHLGRDLITLCEQHVPTLVDPANTAVLEYMLADVEKQKCDTVRAREILQSRNIDAIKRCIAITDAELRAPEGTPRKASTSGSGPSRPFKDFDGGSWELEVPFDDKDAVKSLGGRFNGTTRKWHLPKNAATKGDLQARGWIKA